MNITDKQKEHGLELANKIFEELRRGDKHAIEIAENFIHDIINEIQNKQKADPEILKLIEYNNGHSYNAVHSLNVTMISLIYAYKNDISNETMFEIGMGALLHDMGKINTPDNLLIIQDSNDEYERTALSEHPRFGAHWLSTNTMLTQNIIDIIKGHHENYSGSGYPDGIKNAMLSESTRIVALANKYEYLVSNIPEKQGMTPRNAFFQIANLSGKAFSPKLTASFLNLMTPTCIGGPIFPQKTLLLLNTREIAVVTDTRNNADILPEIIVLTDDKGKKLSRPLKVDLKKDSNRIVLKILKV